MTTMTMSGSSRSEDFKGDYMPRKKKVQIDVNALLKSSTKHYLEQLRMIGPCVTEAEYYRVFSVIEVMVREMLRAIPDHPIVPVEPKLKIVEVSPPGESFKGCAPRSIML